VFHGDLYGQAGPWYMERDYLRDQMVAHNHITHQRVALDIQTQQAMLARAAGIMSMQYGFPALRPESEYLPQKPYRRAFMARVSYLADKARLRHLRKIEKAAWVMGWAWGVILAYVATSALLQWALHTTIG